jgi:hypothetical protein
MGALQLELVVSLYEEDPAWLRRVPGTFRVTAYDKSGADDAANPLPNVGREAHTYLHHLVSRYEDLADVTLFAQGKPFDHVPDFHRILRNLASGRERVDAFRWLGFIIDEDDRTGSRLFRHWGKNEDKRGLCMEDFWKALWDDPVPERFVFYPSAHFAVTRETIRLQPVSFYERALRVATTLPDAAHCFERCWDRVFGVDGIPPAFRDQPKPIYFRPVERLGITWEDVAREEG